MTQSEKRDEYELLHSTTEVLRTNSNTKEVLKLSRREESIEKSGNKR